MGFFFFFTVDGMYQFPFYYKIFFPLDLWRMFMETETKISYNDDVTLGINSIDLTLNTVGRNKSQCRRKG